MKIHLLKRVLALIIAACFFLPLGQCSLKEPLDGERAERTQPTTFMPYEAVDFKDYSSVFLVAIFSWPLLLTLLRSRARGKVARLACLVVGFSASALSLFWLKELFSLYTQILWAGYVLLFAFLLFALVSAIEIGHEFRQSRG